LRNARKILDAWLLCDATFSTRSNPRYWRKTVCRSTLWLLRKQLRAVKRKLHFRRLVSTLVSIFKIKFAQYILNYWFLIIIRFSINKQIQNI